MSDFRTSKPRHPSRRHRRRVALAAARSRYAEPGRSQALGTLTTEELLARHPRGQTPPLRVLDLLLSRFNMLHTSLEKTVSHKTRRERGQFLRRFFRDLRLKGGFRRIPDPRSLGQKHLRAMVLVWQGEQLAPATIQTYLSFLRGLAMWLDKPGLVRAPAFYGLQPDEYIRHEYAQHDKSWTPKGIDVDAIVAEICAYDARVGACLRLIQALALRKKESLLFRPFDDVVGAGATDPSEGAITPEHFARVKGKGGRQRLVALESLARREAVQHARTIVSTRDAHMGDPDLDLERNLRRVEYVMEKFGITMRDLGATLHGLRHEVLNDEYHGVAGRPSPVRGGTQAAPDVERRARMHVATLAGHARIRAAGAYLGQPAQRGGRKSD